MGRIRYAGHGVRPVRSLPQHFHEPWILIVYSHGKGSVIFEDQTFRFRRGTVVCVPPRVPYAETSISGFNSYFIAADRVAHDASSQSFEDSDGIILSLAQLIVRTFNSEEAGVRAVAEQLFDGLTLYLAQQHSALISANPSVDALRKLIHERWADPDFQLAEAMARIGYSPGHLRRKFTTTMKVSPMRYLLTYRIRQACRLMIIGGYSVKEVGYLCGFSDPYYFSRAFRKVEGKSPALWNRQRKGSKHSARS